MNPATITRCEFALYLFAAVLLLLQAATDAAAALAAML